MEPFEKFEIIIKARINQTKAQIQRAENAEHSIQYSDGLRKELDTLQSVSANISEIKRNGGIGSDEAIEKIWKPKLQR